MASTIVTKNSSTASAVPVSGDLTQGELAVNVTDKRLFTKNSGGTVVELGTNPASLALPNGTANGVLYLNGSKVATSGSALTFDGTNLGVGATSMSTWGTASNPTLTIKGTNGSYPGRSGALTLASQDGLSNVSIANDSGSQAVQFYIGTSEQMRLTSTGLGIGTSSPKEKLDSRGAAVFSGDNATGTNAFGTAEGVLLSTGSGVARITAVSNGNNNVNLVLRALNAGSASSSTLMLDSSGNLGLGVTPSAWASTAKAIDIGQFSSVNQDHNGSISVSNNAYQSSSATWTYKSSSFAVRYNINTNNGAHSWYIAPSGTAGNAISFTQAMTLDASGNLGVGTTSPSGKLHVNNTGVGQLVIAYNGTSVNYYDADTQIFRNGAATERARITSSGTLLINSTINPGPVSLFASSNSTTYGIIGARNGTGTNTFSVIMDSNLDCGYLGTSSATGSSLLRVNSIYGTQFTISDSEKMRLDSSGNLLVGATAVVGSERLNVTANTGSYNARFINSNASPYGPMVNYSGAAPNGTSNECWRFEDTGGLRFQVRSNGGVVNYSANNVNLSDRREKTNFAPAGDYLAKICAIPVQTFNYIDQNMEDDPGLTLGVVAQDVEAVAPELVMESNWGTEEEPKMRLSIYQTDLQYALMKALQELKAEFDAYKATHP